MLNPIRHACRTALALLALAQAPMAQDAPAPFASFAGASPQVLNDPHDLAFGPDGRLYVADKFGSRIAVLDPDTLELLETFGDGMLPNVHDISFGPDGKAYIAVTGSNAVGIFDFSGDAPVNEGLIGPFPRTEGALAHSNGRLYVMASGTGQLMAVEGETLLATAGGMPGAHDVAEAPDGTIWVADNFNRRLVQFSPELEQLRILSGPQFGFIGPRYLDVDDFGKLVVADQDAHRVLLIDPATDSLLGVIGSGSPGMGPGLLDDPEGVAIRGPAYYFSDSDNNRVVKYVVALN
ncbi:Vgb family protein [Aliiruegeria sabulilitoris]|uniref:Vgb family protein n=1 Tax=Aliiruegeria sabulilitoris TaxID=1510458 RepID=UPI00082BF6EE|nr:NHL repeat-containing protein [Aliiruegeria sabulilitoris]NDR59457.1 hypothetical protein [Pseudoruegeria sp. M32A2M]